MFKGYSIIRKSFVRETAVSAVAFFFCLTLAGCGQRILNRNAPGNTIVCFGDSITQGVGADRQDSYPAVLDKITKLRVINSGVGGDTTRDALKRVEEDVLSYDPKLVIVILGGNDFLQRLPSEETFRNIEEIVERIQAKGAMVVLGTVKLGFIWDPYSKTFNRIAREHKALMLKNIMSGIMDNPAMKYDGIHPNADGYKLMAERVYKVIKPLIGE